MNVQCVQKLSVYIHVFKPSFIFKRLKIVRARKIAPKNAYTQTQISCSVFSFVHVLFSVRPNMQSLFWLDILLPCEFIYQNGFKANRQANGSHLERCFCFSALNSDILEAFVANILSHFSLCVCLCAVKNRQQ